MPRRSTVLPGSYQLAFCARWPSGRRKVESRLTTARMHEATKDVTAVVWTSWEANASRRVSGDGQVRDETKPRAPQT
jgi:hypothetical protein